MITIRQSWMSLVLLVLLAACVVFVVCCAEEDLYNILGVSRKASAKEIKQAYRRKALDTHPDKNKGNEEASAEAFHKVVQAFEVLSDESSRQRYDRTGRVQDNTQQWQGGRQQWSGGVRFTWNFRSHTVRLKDKFEVQQAQSRVLHVVSLDQLRTIILDDNDRLERSLLMVFFNPSLEKHVTDEMVYPFPFAAMSTQGIWWEDLLQTVSVRFLRSNELTRFFDIPPGDGLKQPIFLYGERGGELVADKMKRLETTDRKVFENWVWQQIEVPLIFVNKHDHPVEIYWIHGGTGTLKEKLEPGHQISHTTMMAHEWYVRDVRVDTRKDAPNRYKLSESSSLGSWKVDADLLSKAKGDGTVEIVIERQTCFDLSGHCPFWNHQGQCTKNPRFMNEVCQLTCKQCKRGENTSGTSNDEL